MKCTIISGKSGSGKTGIILNKLSKEKDNLVVTNDPAVIYIEMYMARNNIPGRCIGINSLAKIVAQDIGLQISKESTKEVEMAIIGKILSDNSDIISMGTKGYNNGIINKIHSFITECKESNISPDDISQISKKVIPSLEMKLNDISLVYREYNKELSKNGFTTKDDLISFIADNLEEKIISFPCVFIDTLDRYNKNTVMLIKKLIPACEEIYIAFNKTSRKAFDYDIYAESMKAMVDVYDYIDTLPYCPVERIEASSTKDINDGLSIIEKELFNRDTETKSTAENVVLHQASTLYKEVDFLIANINKLIENGAKYSEILITSSSMERYINIISAAMKKHNIPYYYFKNTTVEKTLLYEFIDTILDVKINDLNCENLLKLCHLNFFGLTTDEIVAIDTFYNRFGDDLVVALANGKKYDSNNTVIVQNAVQKIMMPINVINDSPKNVKDFISSMYQYLTKIGIQKVITEKAISAKEDGYIHSSQELINTWNDIMSIFSNMAIVFDNTELSLEEIRDVLYKMASEKISNNPDLYHSQLTILDIENAQNRKNKYLFIVGCNEGYMPKPMGVQLITDREKNIINDLLNSDLRLSSIYQSYRTAAIYKTLILPQNKLFLTWSANDIDFKPLRYASIISNVVKTFEENIIPEENLYDNNDEDRFIGLLQNLSLMRYKNIETENLDSEFMYFMSNPNYNNRLKSAMERMKHGENRFTSKKILNGYKEKEYFSVSRLETFNECPFKHYVEFALNPEKKKLFAETSADKGNYNHLAFKMFFDKCLNRIIDLMTISHENYLKELDIIFEEMDKTHNENFLNSSSKNRYLSYTMKEKVKTSLWMAIVQLRQGVYNIFSNEYVVGKNISLILKDENGNDYHITGTIDRIDTNGEYARVIDYKSGLVEFSSDKMAVGIQLQLPLYASAISNEDTKVSGMYYFRIKDFVLDADGDNFPLKEFKLSGPTLSDVNVLMDNDTKLDNGMASPIISAELTQKGEISKKSKVLNTEEIKNIIKNAESIAIETIKKIKEGETKAYPLVIKGYDACEYCKYKCLCNIDKTAKDALRRT